MTTKEESFAGLLTELQQQFDIRTVFDDFLTLTLCALSRDPSTGKSYDEALYLETIKKYKDNSLRHHFPKMFGRLVAEMDDRVDSFEGSDVLGEYYEEHLYRKGTAQCFTPWPLCNLIASITMGCAELPEGKRLNILDPSCGSGRMILASARTKGKGHRYYGIDVDETCVKMTALNLFLNGLFSAEVMCANALDAGDFRGAYRTCLLPLGIFRIQDKEHSVLWHMQQSAALRHEINRESDHQLVIF